MNITINIVLIICATLIALAAIVCDFLAERKFSDSPERRLSQKIIKVHRNYIAGFLGFAVIMLLTSNYGGQDDEIFTYLSFGSTITSLVLSILAIFVTVHSSADLYKQFTRIDSATDTINNVSHQIDSTLMVLRDVESNLQNTSDGISGQLNTIVEQFDQKLQTRMTETQNEISRKLESMNKPIEQRTSRSFMPNTETLEAFKKGFISLTSASGLLALYACALSKEKSKVFELSKIFITNELYTFGFLIACSSAGIVNFTHDQTNNQISCAGIVFSSQELYDAIKSAAQKYGSDYVNRVNAINEDFDIDLLQIQIK